MSRELPMRQTDMQEVREKLVCALPDVYKRQELLFDDKIILDNICSHPMAIWKMKEQKEKEHNHADRH